VKSIGKSQYLKPKGGGEETGGGGGGVWGGGGGAGRCLKCSGGVVEHHLCVEVGGAVILG